MHRHPAQSCHPKTDIRPPLSQLYYFEKLLEEANNDLVREGVAKGLHPIGSVCSLIPEPLLNLPGCFSVRLRASSVSHNAAAPLHLISWAHHNMIQKNLAFQYNLSAQYFPRTGSSVHRQQASISCEGGCGWL